MLFESSAYSPKYTNNVDPKSVEIWYSMYSKPDQKLYGFINSGGSGIDDAQRESLEHLPLLHFLLNETHSTYLQYGPKYKVRILMLLPVLCKYCTDRGLGNESLGVEETRWYQPGARCKRATRLISTPHQILDGAVDAVQIWPDAMGEMNDRQSRWSYPLMRVVREEPTVTAIQQVAEMVLIWDICSAWYPTWYPYQPCSNGGSTTPVCSTILPYASVRLCLSNAKTFPFPLLQSSRSISATKSSS